MWMDLSHRMTWTLCALFQRCSVSATHMYTRTLTCDHNIVNRHTYVHGQLSVPRQFFLAHLLWCSLLSSCWCFVFRLLNGRLLVLCKPFTVRCSRLIYRCLPHFLPSACFLRKPLLIAWDSFLLACRPWQWLLCKPILIGRRLLLSLTFHSSCVMCRAFFALLLFFAAKPVSDLGYLSLLPLVSSCFHWRLRLGKPLLTAGRLSFFISCC
mmetsp:Transcript_27050/g.67391  ORF Transcript_27050/g.67391 Transcript_27050/m.67391 type:complete len:210 (-) Transcript_27050:2044-2673(-)